MSTETTAVPPEVVVTDNGNSIPNVIVNNDGTWQVNVSSLSVSTHEFKATSGSTNSPPWAIKIEAPIPELIIDTSPVVLTGTFYWLNNHDVNLINWPINTTEHRTASGGVPPYSYISSNIDAVRVDSTGYITARRNGSSTITVRDSVNQTVQLTVIVTGAQQLLITMSAAHWNEMVAASGGWNGVLISPNEAQSILSMYRTNWPNTLAEFWAAPNYTGSVVKCLRMNYLDIVDAWGWGTPLAAMIVVR